MGSQVSNEGSEKILNRESYKDLITPTLLGDVFTF